MSLVTTSDQPRERRKFPEALKRQIVAETFEAGNSVSQVARRHNINANQLFAWRRRFGPRIPLEQKMLPVLLQSSSQCSPTEVREPSGSMEISVREKRITIQGSVSVTMLRTALKLLSD